MLEKCCPMMDTLAREIEAALGVCNSTASCFQYATLMLEKCYPMMDTLAGEIEAGTCAVSSNEFQLGITSVRAECRE